MPLEVIGAGWGRTGTMSLKAALDTLGYPCYHMTEMFQHKEHIDEWMKANKGEPVDFDMVLGEYKACVDWPAVSFYKQLLERNPQAKVILTVRDPVKWYNSSHATVWRGFKAMTQGPWFVRAVNKRMGPGLKFCNMVDAFVWRGSLQGCFENDPQRAQQLFLEHIEEVKKTVPQEQLLVWEPSQGWGPLCAFLGKPVPDQPFPHLNDMQTFIRWIPFVERQNAVLRYAMPVLSAVLVAGLAWLVTWLARGQA